MNNDLRQQILVSLRAEGVGEADKARQALAQIEAEMQKVSKAFGDGETTGEQFRKTISSLGTDWKFFSELLKASEQTIDSVDVGLHKLQMTAIKFGDDYQAAIMKAAQAAEDLAMKEAEAFSKAAATHEAFLAKAAAAEEVAAIKKAELLAKEVAAEIAADEKAAASAAAAVQQEEQRFNKMMADRQAYLAKTEAAEEAAAITESERHAKLLADYEAFLAKEAAAADRAELQEAERIAKLIAAHEAADQKEDARLTREQAKYEQMLARKDAAAEKEELQEAERLAALAANHEKYLEREAAAEQKTASEIASARASLNQQRRDTLDAAFVSTQDEALKTQRLITGVGTAADHSHDKANKFGYAMLNVSHAFQDLQYGIGAVLNNIPLIMTSFGFGPGAAGAVMAMGVAVELLRGQLGDLGAALGMADDPAKKLGGTIEEVKAKIAAIDGKTFKFAVDFKDLEDAEARLKRLQKLKGLIEGTSETGEEKNLSKVAQDITTEKAGGSDALQKAVAEIEATRGIDHANPTDVNIARNAQTEIDRLTKLRQSQGDWLGAGTDMLIWDMTRRRDNAQNSINKSRAGFVDEQVGKFLAGDPAAIAAMKNRVAQFPGAFTPAGAKAITEMAGTPEANTEQQKQKKFAEQSRALIAEFEDFSKGDEALKDQQAAKKKIDDAKAKDARTHDQAVNAHVNRYDGEFGKQQGPGSLTDAIIGRIGAGQSNSDIVSGMSGQVKGKISDVPAALADEVADKIIDNAASKIRAQAAGVGGLGALADQRRDKLDRAQGLADRREGREQAGAFEMSMAQDIFNTAGGGLNEAGAMHAAHKAMQAMKGGASQQQAMWGAMMATMEDVAAGYFQTNMQMAGYHSRLNQLEAKVKRHRPQRPGLLPQF